LSLVEAQRSRSAVTWYERIRDHSTTAQQYCHRYATGYCTHALTMPGDRERSLEAGADVYLSKPVRLRHLAEEIAALLERKPAQRR
ncbi:MAG: hypothetical protein ACUVSY_17370, partial [Roseiflexus sp.]